MAEAPGQIRLHVRLCYWTAGLKPYVVSLEKVYNSGGTSAYPFNRAAGMSNVPSHKKRYVDTVSPTPMGIGDCCLEFRPCEAVGDDQQSSPTVLLKLI